MGKIEIKICGLTNLDDALFSIEHGADYLGFVLYKGSPRGVDAVRLERIRSRLPAAVRVVGVFVNTRRRDAERIAGDCELFAVQLHGDEAADEFAGTKLRLWRAIHVRPGEFSPDPAVWPADRYVVDAAAPGKYGGTGTLADWAEASKLAKQYPLMLGGGLKPENVTVAIRSVRPMGVDVASGVESRPGHKDRGKIVRFILAARSAVDDG